MFTDNMTVRQTRTRSWIIALTVLCSVLFVFGAVARAEHAHHHACPQAAQQCPACLAHASTATAVLSTSDALEYDVAATDHVVAAPCLPVLAHTPLILACRGPPSRS